MKISFIVPSWHYYSDPFKHQLFGKSILYATNLKKQGYNVLSYDMRNLSLNFKEHANKIPESDFIFIGFLNLEMLLKYIPIAKYLKEKFPKYSSAGGTKSIFVKRCF